MLNARLQRDFYLVDNYTKGLGVSVFQGLCPCSVLCCLRRRPLYYAYKLQGTIQTLSVVLYMVCRLPSMQGVSLSILSNTGGKGENKIIYEGCGLNHDSHFLFGKID